jgi:hypothetical protein
MQVSLCKEAMCRKVIFLVEPCVRDGNESPLRVGFVRKPDL